MIDYCHECAEVHSAYDYINGMLLQLMKLDSVWHRVYQLCVCVCVCVQDCKGPTY